MRDLVQRPFLLMGTSVPTKGNLSFYEEKLQFPSAGNFKHLYINDVYWF